MAQKAQEFLGSQHLQAVADSGYFNPQHLKDCLEAGITPYVPQPDRYKDARLDGKSEPWSHEYTTKVIRTAKQFYLWLQRQGSAFEAITDQWLETFKPPRAQSKQRKFKAVTIEEMFAMANAPAESLLERRAQVAVAILFLSGMRVGAFASLPLEAVDLESLSVKQWPELGVRTKNDKRETTFLMNIPELLSVVRRCDRDVRAAFTKKGYWFAPLSSNKDAFDTGRTEIGRYRPHMVRKDLRRWCKKVGLPYRTPHQFRHGCALYGLQRSKDMADYTAVSQNLMHSDIRVTNGLYGTISEEERMKRIASLGQQEATKAFDPDPEGRHRPQTAVQLALFGRG